ncbi:MAG: tRNA glutamyl-Q(34) synthetase GluQRS [Pseudomonadota bacterium]
MGYRGRFAPTPSGALHLGSLFSALISFLDAKIHDGEWLIRIDDLDKLRARDEFIPTYVDLLADIGLCSDGPIVKQSERLDLYTKHMHILAKQKLLFYCDCSRQSWAKYSIYPGYCRQNTVHQFEDARPIRIQTPNRIIKIDDRWQPLLEQNLAVNVGDFIVCRRDGFFSYHFGTVVDDADQGITHIVRGVDLLPSTPRQLFLHQCFNHKSIPTAHHPILVNSDFSKLSKSAASKALTTQNIGCAVEICLNIIGLHPPTTEKSPESQIHWAIQQTKRYGLSACLEQAILPTAENWNK